MVVPFQDRAYLLKGDARQPFSVDFGNLADLAATSPTIFGEVRKQG